MHNTYGIPYIEPKIGVCVCVYWSMSSFISVHLWVYTHIGCILIHRFIWGETYNNAVTIKAKEDNYKTIQLGLHICT